MNRLSELASLFLKLGIIGFGGPAAHIAMMEEEVVKQRQWLTREHFLDLIGATNLIPGPNSTEMAIHVGYIRAGWLGLITAGVCFILPSVLITAGFAWVYVKLGTLPAFSPMLNGIKPVVLAIIFSALWRLGQKAVKSRKLLFIAFGVVALLLSGINEVIALLLGGVIGAIWLNSDRDVPPKITNLVAIGLLMRETIAAASVSVTQNISVWKLGLFFLKVGSVLFGSGYVLIAFLEGELVQDYGWLTQQQLLDAIAIGQFTPGPILSTATFIGYIIAGIPGAIAATIGIFLPSFLFVALLNPLIPRLRASKWTAAFLDAINVSSVALMGAVSVNLAIATLTQPVAPYLNISACILALIATILATRYKTNAAWLVLGGAIVGLISNEIIRI